MRAVPLSETTVTRPAAIASSVRSRQSSPSCQIVEFARTATADVELQGRRIRAGDTVGVFYRSDNRDESVFESPCTFDVGRQPNDHLGFGHGVRYCLGANPARRELRAMLRRSATAAPPPVGRRSRPAQPLHVGAVRHQLVRLSDGAGPASDASRGDQGAARRARRRLTPGETP